MSIEAYTSPAGVVVSVPGRPDAYRDRDQRMHHYHPEQVKLLPRRRWPAWATMRAARAEAVVE